MKCSLGISNFLEEISNLSNSIVFLYFFALITEEVFFISPCYSLELCIQTGIFRTEHLDVHKCLPVDLEESLDGTFWRIAISEI